jgi:hypothetical protein
MDILNELLVSSESLTTQISETGGVVKNLRRGVRNQISQLQHHGNQGKLADYSYLWNAKVAELDQASKSLGTGAGSAFQNNDQLGAVRLLSQRNFDAIQYSTEANNLTLDVSYFNDSFLWI